jgi:hypothetical protein
LENSTSLGHSGVLSVGIVAEGEKDIAVLEVLIPRIRSESNIARRITTNGPMKKKIATSLQALQFNVTPEGPVDRALVIGDSNGKPPEQVEEDMRTRAGNRAYNFPRGFAFHAVQQAMETWLLADENAISRVAGRPVPPAGGQLEALVNPKARFQTVLTRAGLLVTPTTYGRITAEVNLDVLRDRCRGFVRFEQKVLSDD